MEDESKIIEEVAKAAGKFADLAKEVNKFLIKVFGPATEEMGHIAQDWVRYYRYKNLLVIKDKMEAIHKQRRVEGKTISIPPRYALPLIQNASEEDDETLQDMWAGLIANFTDPNKRFDPKKIYSEILSSLEPLDAKVLKFFSTQGWKLFPKVPGGGVTISKLVQNIGVNEKDLQLSLQNLARLGCIIDEGVETWDSMGSSSFGKRVTEPGTTFRPSSLGFDLIKVCEIIDSDK